MNSYFGLYLLTRLDAFQALFMTIGILGFAFILLTFIGMAIDGDFDVFTDEEKRREKKKTRNAIRRQYRWIIPFSALAVLLATLTPSRKEAVFILVGGKTLEWAASDTSLSKIPSQATAIISEYFDAQLNKLESEITNQNEK
jgi:4-hydroxybenzoate polyprenyltransferase